MILKWLKHRHHHLEAMIYPLTQLYDLRSSDQMTRVVEWLNQAWVFEMVFLQSPHITDQ